MERAAAVNEFDAFLLDCVCDSINGPGNHRWGTSTQTDGTEISVCADCGIWVEA